jgi:SAM-dependent methyltransferase
MTDQMDRIAVSVSGVSLSDLKLVRRINALPQFAGIHDANFHAYRYSLSLQFLRDNFIKPSLTVLELGEPGPFTEMLKQVFPKWEIQHQELDLRKGLMFDNEAFDLVVSTEVLEHIADSEIGHEITSQGVKDHLRDIYRVLKSDGHLFLTTPNASSIWCIKRILMGEPPLIYERHYREFSHQELNDLVEQSGLIVIKHESKVVWNFWDFSDIENFMKENNYDLENRGDDQFILAWKSEVN